MNGKATILFSGLGTSGQIDISRTKDAVAAREISLPAGHTVTDWVKTDGDTAACNLPADHGQTDGVFDAFWEVDGVSYCHYGATATITTNAVALDGGSGDDFPASATTGVVLTKQVAVALDVVGNNLSMLIAHCDQMAHVDLQETAGTSHLAFLIAAANEGYLYSQYTGVANPIAGDTVNFAMASNGSTTAATLKLGALLDSTT